MKSRLKRNSIYPTVILLLFLLLFMFPLYWMFLCSITPSEALLTKNLNLLPDFSKINLGSYHDLLHNYPLVTWFANTLIIVFFSCLVSMAVSLMAGYSLSRFRSKGQFWVGVFLLLNRMLPSTLMLIPLYIMFTKMGIGNTHQSVIIADVTAAVPFCTWMMKGFFDTIPGEVDESAKIDGCTNFRAFRSIMLPLTIPGLAATTIYSAIVSWGDYIHARTLLTSSGKWTLTMGAASFMGEHTVNWSNMMAMGSMAIIPIFILFVFLEPFLVGGLTSGAVKG